MKKYFAYQQSVSVSEGLNHQRSNLQCFLEEAYLLDRIAIIPIFNLTAGHNKEMAIRNNLTPYYNLNKIMINDQKKMVVSEDHQLKIPDDSDKTLRVSEYRKITASENQKYQFIVRDMSSLLWRFTLAKNYPNRPDFRITLTPTDEILDVVKSASKILAIYSSIHIRREDRLKEQLFLNWYTSPKMILRKCKKHIPKNANLYLMSDESASRYFDLIQKNYQIYRWYDLPPVKEAIKKRPNDNYFLFAIELAIWKGGKIRISTNKNLPFPSDAWLYPPPLFFKLKQYTCNKYLLMKPMLRFGKMVLRDSSSQKREQK